MKKTIFSLFIFLIFSQTQLFAQNTNDNSFRFIGGSLGVNASGEGYNDGAQLNADLELLYMGKVWGKLALGGAGSFGIGIPLSCYDSLSEDDQLYTNKSLSLLAGTIFNNPDGGKITFVAGPVIGANNQLYLAGRMGLYFQPKDTNWSYGINGIYGVQDNGSGGPKDKYAVKLSVGYAF